MNFYFLLLSKYLDSIAEIPAHINKVDFAKYDDLLCDHVETPLCQLKHFGNFFLNLVIKRQSALWITRLKQILLIFFFIDKVNSYPSGNLQAALENSPNYDNDDDKFKFRIVSADEAHKAILKIKSDAIGYDGILLKFVKMFIDLLPPYITLIFNKIITTSFFLQFSNYLQ